MQRGGALLEKECGVGLEVVDSDKVLREPGNERAELDGYNDVMRESLRQWHSSGVNRVREIP